MLIWNSLFSYQNSGELGLFSTFFISGLPVTISVNFNEGCSVIILKLFSKTTVLCQSNQALQALLVGGTMIARWSNYPRHYKSVRHKGSHKIAGNKRNLGPEWTPEKLTSNPIPNWYLQRPCFESAAGNLPCKALHLLLTPFSILTKSFTSLETLGFLLFFLVAICQPAALVSHKIPGIHRPVL